jgi:hypothetical protein
VILRRPVNHGRRERAVTAYLRKAIAPPKKDCLPSQSQRSILADVSLRGEDHEPITSVLLVNCFISGIDTIVVICYFRHKVTSVAKMSVDIGRGGPFGRGPRFLVFW